MSENVWYRRYSWRNKVHCFERAKVNYGKESLIVMDDVCDGYMVGLTQMYRSRVILRRRWSGDRSLLDMAWKKQADGHKCQLGLFVGHTTAELYNTLQPIHVCNVWNIDNGAGWSAKPTIMDVDSKEYWRSDLNRALYAEIPDRL